MFSRFVGDEHGATAIDRAVILAAIAIVIMAALRLAAYHP
jgi:Flp pilus assembly pilin Flp